MTPATIIRELERLPLTDKLLVIGRTLRSIRIEKEKSLKLAVDQLYDDYRSDPELTAFTQLDAEPFQKLRWGTVHIIIMVILSMCQNSYSQDTKIKQEILLTGETIRRAFADGDIEKIRSLHHPEVIKALGYNKLLTGRDAVIADLKGTVENVNLEFVQNDIESFLIRENTVIEQTRFSIRGTPRNGDKPFIFKGRTMVTYIRYDKSPTGWATIREIIQPATE